MSYQQYRGNNALLQPPLPPTPMMPGMGMMGGHGYDNVHQNYNMNHSMMMPGMNDTPLEFKSMQPPPPLPSPRRHPSPPMPKEIPPMTIEFDLRRDELEIEKGRHNKNNNLSNDTRGSHNRRSSRDSRRRERDEEARGVERHNRSRSDYRGRKFDVLNDRGGKNTEKKDLTTHMGSDNGPQNLNMPSAVNTTINGTGQQIPVMNASEGLSSANSAGNAVQQGMMYGGMGMGGMFPSNIMGMMGGMMMDPTMMSMGQYGMADPSQMTTMPLADVVASSDMSMMAMGSFPLTQAKDTIQLKSCSLVPPYPSSVLPTTREKPSGCRTVFIGSLPENVTEEILTEVFERCGEINSLRLSKKNFCHIRYVYEQSVDAAVFLSGYRLRIDNKTDGPNCSRLHVDYAQARDDQHEFECKQRAAQREARHRERMAARHRPPSPPPIHHYTDHDAADICDKIKQDENFNKAVQVVISWLERGDCTKKNVNVFYSMIQSTNSHVRRLLNDKTLYEEELQRAKDEAKIKMQTLLVQFGEVEKVFAAASHKKVWDHFSKAQRKNIEIWKKQSSEIRILQLEDFLQETGGGEEMDCSDEESTPRKRSKLDDDRLQEENDSLKCQLEAYKNEIDVMRSENVYEIDSKSQNIHHLKSRIGVLENQLVQAKKNQVQESVKLRIMEAKIRTSLADKMEETKEEKADKDAVVVIPVYENGEKAEPKPELPQNLSANKEAKLIGVTSTFLHVHPFGASTDYLWSYVHKMEPELRQNQLEELLCRFPTVFVQSVSGVGANIERKWIFNGFTDTEA